MTNKLMLSDNHVKARPGAVFHTDVAVMNVQSVGGASYFVIFIDGASGLERAFPMKKKVEPAELLRRQASWVKGQSGFMVKEIVLDDGGRISQGIEGS